MDREQLEQYRKLKKEIAALDKSIEILSRKLEQVPVVMGSVQASMDDFPYTRTHLKVEINDPAESKSLKKRIMTRDRRRIRVLKIIEDIEEYIETIPDSTDRQIFEMVYLYGMTYAKVADALGYDRSSIGKRIKRQLSPHSPF